MWDVAILGGGPAGVTAALYTARAGLSTVLVSMGGGALEKASNVENFYGHVSISGKDLYSIGIEQATNVGTELITDEAVGVVIEGDTIKVTTASAGSLLSKALVLATGASRTTPGIKHLSDFEGRGVSYCAICDGAFYRGKDVAVLGSGLYALHEAYDLRSIVSSVTLLTNGEQAAAEFPDDIIIRKDKILEITGGIPESPPNPFLNIKNLMPQKPHLNGIIFENGDKLDIGGLFVAVGIAGGTALARKVGATINSQGMILVDEEMKTNVPGLWAAGDCTVGPKQIVKAAYEGMVAGMSVVKNIQAALPSKQENSKPRSHKDCSG